MRNESNQWAKDRCCAKTRARMMRSMGLDRRIVPPQVMNLHHFGENSKQDSKESGIVLATCNSIVDAQNH
jgi:hypothetical protein